MIFGYDKISREMWLKPLFVNRKLLFCQLKQTVIDILQEFDVAKYLSNKIV
jgi:hypothetical protein